VGQTARALGLKKGETIQVLEIGTLRKERLGNILHGTARQAADEILSVEA